MLFNTKTCESRINYTRFNGTQSIDALTVEGSKTPGASLQLKMKTFVRPRISSMTLDSRLNSNFVILTNIYQFYLLAAIKTHAYVKAMNGGITRNETFMVSSIVDLTEYSHSLIYKRVSGADFAS